ncbi:aminoglycoside N(3)-acetyltransferase [Candidatus Rariloculus sp.]|uniref:aminoglycoside N(3)-acetyltransferase n=1 Tax=Candidatus Rariloculus sp. TaxID=3101265 RepID=UPI003D10650B
MTTKERVLSDADGREPVTRSRLAAELAALGLARGAVVIVHTSLSKIGWVPGGAQAIIEALLEVLGEIGTLVMPAHSAHLTDPARWKAPPVPKAWWDTIREEMPAYDPARTPTRAMGVVAETFRTYPGVRRSAHPHVSFAALGPAAETVVEEHPLGSMFGERSPLARLYALDAEVLLAGVGHANNTALHLGEYRADFPGKRTGEEGAPMLVDGRRQWVRFTDTLPNNEDFPDLGKDFAQETGQERCGPLGWGEARLMRVRAVVDYAERWMATHRST